MFDLFGKKKREETARLVAEAEAIAKKELQAKKRKESQAKKLVKEAADQNEAEAEADRKAQENKSPKAVATAAGEPWVNVLGIEVDPNNLGAGAFELDWNDIFVARLMKSGYQGKTDADVVDNWFQDVCRHVVMETYAQEQADPDKRAQQVKRQDLGGGKAEFS